MENGEWRKGNEADNSPFPILHSPFHRRHPMSTITNPREIPFVPESEEPLPSLRKTNGRLLWLASVDHKQIGIMYVVVAIFFFVVAGCEALLMRLQLIAPNNTFLSPGAYNQVFTMHGTTMVFLMGMPLVAGLG